MEFSHFLSFIILFVLNIGCATYLVFTYNRNRIVLFSALAFLILAIRSCTEFYLPLVEDFEIASEIVRFHSYVIIVTAIILGIGWWHVRPFKNHPKEKLIGKIFIIFFAITYPILFVLLYLRIPFKVHPEKIDGYWKYYLDFSTPWGYYLHVFHVLTAAMIISIFIVSLIREPNQRLLKYFFLIIYSIIPIGLLYRLLYATPTDYTAPSGGLIYTVINLIASRIFTGSRLFTDTSIDIIGDTFNSIGDLVVFTYPDFRIRQYNEQADTLFGLDKEDLNWAEILSSNSSTATQNIESSLNDLILNENDKQELELLIDGRKTLFLVSAAPYLKAKQLFGYTFFLQDITEERVEEEQLAKQNTELKALNDVKDRIFAIIGNDLRKPAIAFRGITRKINQLLKKQDYDTLNKLGDKIEQEAFALNKLTDNLLSWALTQKKILPHHPQKIRLAPLAEEVLHAFKNSIAEKSIRLFSDIPSQLEVFADKDTLSTIIRNLIDNAIQYTPIKGRISIRATEEQAGVRIEVVDTGDGIVEDKLENFLLLQQDKMQNDTGLGLHLIYELTSLNAGKVEVESTRGKGTSFSVILPDAKLRLVS